MQWHPMSESTPPPCRVGSQNQALCGPPCSSAERARHERTHRRRRRPRAARVRSGAPSCGSGSRSTRSATPICAAQLDHPARFGQVARERLLADEAAQLRAVVDRRRDLFHHRDAAEVRREDRDDVDVRGPSRARSRTRAPSPRPRARTDAASASGGVRDVSPATSTPRTLSSARRWNAADEPATDDPVAQRLHAFAVSRRRCSRAGRPGRDCAGSHVVCELDVAALLGRRHRRGHQLEHVQRERARRPVRSAACAPPRSCRRARCPGAAGYRGGAPRSRSTRCRATPRIVTGPSNVFGFGTESVASVP